MFIWIVPVLHVYLVKLIKNFLCIICEKWGNGTTRVRRVSLRYRQNYIFKVHIFHMRIVMSNGPAEVPRKRIYYCASHDPQLELQQQWIHLKNASASMFIADYTPRHASSSIHVSLHCIPPYVSEIHVHDWSTPPAIELWLYHDSCLLAYDIFMRKVGCGSTGSIENLHRLLVVARVGILGFRYFFFFAGFS